MCWGDVNTGFAFSLVVVSLFMYVLGVLVGKGDVSTECAFPLVVVSLFMYVLGVLVGKDDVSTECAFPAVHCYPSEKVNKWPALLSSCPASAA